MGLNPGYLLKYFLLLIPARRAFNKTMYFEFFSGLICEAKNVNLGEFGVYDIDVNQG